MVLAFIGFVFFMLKEILRLCLQERALFNMWQADIGYDWILNVEQIASQSPSLYICKSVAYTTFNGMFGHFCSTSSMSRVAQISCMQSVTSIMTIKACNIPPQSKTVQLEIVSVLT